MTMQTWSDVRSQALGMATSLTVFTPEAMTRQESRVPGLLVLLHGLTGNHAVWPMRTDLQSLADRHNLVIALPDGARSFWLDQAVGLEWGRWVGSELPALLRSVLRVSAARSETFIGGLSMGGYGAVRAAFDYPRTFGGVISLSGTLDVAERAFRSRHLDLYEIGFGDLERPRRSDDLVTRMAAAAPNTPTPNTPTPNTPTPNTPTPNTPTLSPATHSVAVPLDVRCFAVCGTEDRLLKQNRRFRDIAEEIGLDLTYREGPGGHDYVFWNEWLPVGLDHLRGTPS
ncbi:alpha/beta hydrolase family protein [Schaalia sp. JY-X169]|uniref:alpha/beta hydrolase n=1 Tax=Schaalia sp. JY-X169 TaxID=2758572 RepID=UPI0015F3D974|nr:alpha/beta hydrolase-fold protein [Schaalia sp. JY-X169]